MVAAACAGDDGTTSGAATEQASERPAPPTTTPVPEPTPTEIPPEPEPDQPTPTPTPEPTPTPDPATFTVEIPERATIQLTLERSDAMAMLERLALLGSRVRRFEQARSVALMMTDDINAVSVVATRSALTGPTAAANIV